MTRTVDFWCSRIPYIDHAVPVWSGLDDEQRGRFMVPEDLFGYARSLGIEPSPQTKEQSDSPLVFLSRSEFPSMPHGRQLVFIEHGVGANYNGRSHLPFNREVALVLTNPAQGEVHRRVYGAKVVVVGCPKMDAVIRARKKRVPKVPVIAFSHHWNQKMVPETRSAWPWDADAIERIVASGLYRIIGHKHPGDSRPIEGWWRSLGVEFVDSFDEVLRRADLYIADNTSTLYEFAATGRPVVCLTPPFYRRNVEHGMRFWSYVPGIECANLGHLEACIAEALLDAPERRALREAAVEAAYGPLDARATERAIEAIGALELSERTPDRSSDKPLVLPRRCRLVHAITFNGSRFYGGQLVPRQLAAQMITDGALSRDEIT